MMGRKGSDQGQFFYAFNLEDHVPKDHLLRGIDRFLDLSGLREHPAPYYSHIGRPSIDPELMIRMLIVGYCFGIRSERRLCEEVTLNLAYRWFCHLSIEDTVPDHSTFSKNRHGRFRDAEAFRYVFEQVLRRCIVEGLVGGEGFATDASIVKADASRRRHHEEDDDDWGGGSRAIDEYLNALDRSIPPGGQPVKKVSQTDPASRWTAAPGGPAFYAYSTNYLIDTDAGIIMDVEATPANRSLEVASTQAMIERVEERLKIKPQTLIGDTAYGTAKMLGWLVEQQAITLHVPVFDKSEGKVDLFGRSDFIWEDEADRYVCPGGQSLRRNRRQFKKARVGITKANTIIYRASESDCGHCSMKAQCCPTVPARKIHR
ncbi:MAG: transposase, partial [Gammaproteobacteria bacterium]|nr:transposase [Gammaproteobacteria bacterium]